MTIGIAAVGPSAGAAVIEALRAAETIGVGEIGGFAVLAALSADGKIERIQTQRGGTARLEPSASLLTATRACVISSGPDRPEPLDQFLPGLAGVGLVTGHRLPNTPGRDGVPLNLAVLERLARGAPPEAAVRDVLDSVPEADAGLIALSAAGQIFVMNSKRVERRPDRGSVTRAEGIRALAVLHNAILAPVNLAEAVADIAWAHMGGAAGRTALLRFALPVAIRPAARDRVSIDDQNRVILIETADPWLPSASRRGSAVYLGTEVIRDGQLVGHTITEARVEIRDGQVVSLFPGAVGTIAMQRRHT